MASVVDAVATGATSESTKNNNPLALTAIRTSLLGQEPEGYAKACAALAGATDKMEYEKIECRTLVITGDEDKVAPPELCRKYQTALPNCQGVVVLENVGHWHTFEDGKGVSTAIADFLGVGR